MLSVVIPVRNAADTIAGQLEALAGQCWREPWEIVIADNGSTDGLAAVVEGFRPRLPPVRIVPAAERIGGAHARNVGVRAAQGQALAFCDADDRVGDGWVAAMGEALARHECVACRVDDVLLNPSPVRALWDSSGDATPGFVEYLGFLPAAPGCGFGLRRSVFERVGEFDEELQRLADIDYSWRVQLLGPGSRVRRRTTERKPGPSRPGALSACLSGTIRGFGVFRKAGYGVPSPPREKGTALC